MILLVGGAGFIGSHMAKLLRRIGEPHLVLDNLERGHETAISSSPWVRADLRDPDSLEAVFTSHPEIDTVMHFAAYIEVGESVADPAKFYENNFVGVFHLAEKMRHHKVRNIIFSSTAAVYGEPKYVPLDEDHPKAPKSPYGDTKLAVERMLAAYDAAYGFRSICLRYFNAAGADPEGELGEDHRPESHLVPIAIQAALGRRAELRVFGDDYDTPDGTCVRDYVHVCDLADAHLLAVRRLREGGASGSFNLGNGLGYSVREVIDSVERVLGREVPRMIAPRREGDPARLVASSELARSVLGWTPSYPELDSMVAHAAAWLEAHPIGYGE